MIVEWIFVLMLLRLDNDGQIDNQKSVIVAKKFVEEELCNRERIRLWNAPQHLEEYANKDFLKSIDQISMACARVNKHTVPKNAK